MKLFSLPTGLLPTPRDFSDRSGGGMPPATPGDGVSLEDVSQEYARLKARRDELMAEEVRLFNRSREFSSRARAGITTEKPAKTLTVQDQRVAELLGDPKPKAPELETLLTSLSGVEHRRADVRAAIELLESRMAVERRNASAIVCERIAPEYRALVADICEKLLELYAAVGRYEDYTDKLNEKQIAWANLWPMPLSFASNRGIRGAMPSDAVRYLREAARQGFIKPSRLPK
jgi:hypothetical protein